MKAIKKYLPKSLFSRALLIIILPVIIMQIAVAYFFFNAHWNRVTAKLSDSVAADISIALELYKQAPSTDRATSLDNMLRPNMELSVVLRPDDRLPTSLRRSFFSALDNTLRRALNENITHPFWFDTTRYPHHIDIRVAVDEGVLRFIVPRERVFAPTGFVFVFWLTTATILLTLVSILFIRNQARPIARLAAAADAFGKGQDIQDFKPSGASEVRLAGHSFLKMRQRIKRQIEQRTTFLAGVSHDLRTPLTRLNLHHAMQEDTPENQLARQDLKEMENMLEGYLDFARGLSGEPPKLTHMKKYLETIIQSQSDPKPDFHCIKDCRIQIKPMTLKRAIENLLGNARKYANMARLTLDQQGDTVIIAIDDDGPGIPTSDREQAFRPFQRLDEARNQNIDGVGLGLSIARDVAHGHGGSLELEDSELGGLRAILRLPR